MLRPWNPNLIVRAEGRGSLSVRIAQAIIEEIQRGRLTAGDSLPGTRDLAKDLEVNRKTVVQAYDELAAQGWVTTDQRRGTFIARNIRDGAPKKAEAEPAPSFAAPRGRAVKPPPLWPRCQRPGSTTASRISGSSRRPPSLKPMRARRGRPRARGCSAMAIRAAPRPCAIRSRKCSI